MSDVKNIRTIGGEDIIARLVKEDEHFVIVKRPMVLQWIPNKKGEVEPKLMDYAPLAASDTIPLERHAVSFVTEADSKIQVDYIRITTGIEVPPPAGLILD